MFVKLLKLLRGLMSGRKASEGNPSRIETRPILEELEPRQLFSGGIEGVLLADPLAESATHLDITEESDAGAVIIADIQSSESAADTVRQELVFIDTDVDNYQELLNDILAQGDSERNIQVVILDNQRDGIEQISEVLAGYQNLDAVHLISHGSDGRVDVGNTQLDSESLSENSAVIKAWSESFSEDGDFLIYGCNLAATEDGQSLINALSTLTETDVAASDDLTGHESLGGDWELEYQSGNIESSVSLSSEAQQTWVGVLADTTTGLLGHWSFDIDAHDSSGNLNDGTLTSGASVDTSAATNQVGSGKLSLDGSNDYVNLDAHVSNFQGLTEGTISAWVKTTGGSQWIFSASDSGDNFSDISLRLDSSGHLEFDVYNDGAILAVESTASINDGLWHHVAVTVDTSGNALFIDGVQAAVNYNTGSASSNVFFDDVTNLDSMGIGRLLYSGGSSFHFNGQIDDVRVYDSALSAGTVTALANPSISNTFIVSTTADSGPGSLRQAILDANANSGVTDTITFDIGADGSQQTITLLSALDPIDDAVIIDGFSQYGPALTPTMPIIELNGAGTTGANGLELIAGSGGSTINGLIINNFDGVGIYTNSDNNTIAGNYIGTDAAGIADEGNGSWGIEIFNASGTTIGGNTALDRNVISGNDDSGISLYGAGTTGTIIQGNFIGTNAAGIAAIANVNNGIRIATDVSNTTIGGTIAAERNLISGNVQDGVFIGFDAFNNTVSGNYIGTDITGIVALGNGRYGVTLYNGVKNNTVGGTVAGAGNVISANTSDGIVIDAAGGSTTDNNLIQGNYIGTDKNGTADLGNGGNGIHFFNGADSNTIGGMVAGAGNVISGNSGAGIYFEDAGTDNNVIQGNYIGTDNTGTVALGNSSNNVNINSGASSNTIGGSVAGAGNVIADSGNDGITIWGGSTTGNTVQGNYIGTDTSGTINLGNSAVGVVVSGGSNNNIIGGTGAGAGAGNTIAYNNDTGVSIRDFGSLGNSILTNSIYNNVNLGIDLGTAGVTGNDVGDGDNGTANNLQNFPILSTATTDGTTSITVDGTFNSNASTTFRIEFFSNSIDDGNGEGETYLGFANVTTDGSGNATFSTTISATVATGSYISATATNLTTNDTCEFAQNVIATVSFIAPINSVPAAQTTNEDTALIFNTTNSNLISIDDADAGGNPVEVTLSVTNGALTLSGLTGLTFSTGNGTADASITFSGTVTDINNALDGLSYTPAANYNGADTLTLSTLDSELTSITIDANLLGYYSFDDAAALGNDDSPAGANDATINGATATVDGTRGDVLSFDGNDNVQINGLFGNPADVTLAAWVDLTTVDTNSSHVISLGDSVMLVVDRTEGGPFGVGGAYYDGTNWSELNTGTFIEGTGWHHIAYAFDDTNDTHTIYIDGVAINSAAVTDSISYTLGADTYIGTHATGSTTYDFTGKIDEARIYDRALTAGEILTLSNDLNLQDTDTVAITVNSVNDAPVLRDLEGDSVEAVNDGSTVSLDTAALATVTDPENSSSYDGGYIQMTGIGFDAIDLLGLDATGTLSMSAGFTDGSIVSVGGTAVGTLSGVSNAGATIALNANAAQTEVNTLLQSLTFSSTASNFGSRGVDITFNDGDGTANGGVDTTTVSVIVNLASATNGQVNAVEDTGYIFTAADFAFTGVTGGDLSSITITTLPANGLLRLNGSAVIAGQTISRADIDTGLLTFTANADESGSAYASFDFYVNAGQQSVTVLPGDANAYTINSSQLTATDNILKDDNNFGAGGTIPTYVNLGPATSTVDAAYLAGGDILFDGFVPDANLTAAELAAIDAWVSAGGIMISTNDSASYDPVATHYGLTIGGTASSTWHVADDSHPIMSGRFGLVGNNGDSFSAAGTISYFDSASLQVGDQVLAVDSVSGEPTIVLRQRGSGWVLFMSDEGPFRTSMIGDGSVATANEIFAANVFAWAIDTLAEDIYQMSVNVAAVNDDPTNTGSLPTDVTVIEDTPGFIDLSAINFSDVDAGNSLIQVTLSTSNGGVLTAASDFDVIVSGSGFSTMTLQGAVADLNNFFNSVSRLQYSNPTTHLAGDNADTITITVNDLGNTGSGGGTNINFGTVNVDITPKNDAPVLTAGTVSNLTVNEDSGLTSLGLGSVAYGPGGGADESGQTLNYTVTAIPSASVGDVFLADGTTRVTAGSYTLTQIRGMQFKPADNISGTTAFQFNVTDSGGTANGGSNSISQFMLITIDPVNDAPLLAGANDLTAIPEDAFTNSGTSVSALIAGQYSDPDGVGPSGIAVTGVDNTNGSWEFSTDNGSNWNSLGSPTSDAARLLAADANTRVRFVPNPDFNGTVTNGLTFHAWDQTSGSNGGVVDVSAFDTVSDGFGSVSYTNNNGSTNWTTGWIESDNSGGGATGGNIHVDGGSLRLNVAACESGDNIYREIDLSGATTATLTFDYENLLVGEDEIRVQVSANGGASYSNLMVFTGTTNTGIGNANIDISGYTAADTRFRLYVVKNDAGASLQIDNVQVLFDSPATAPGGDTAFGDTAQSSDITVTPINDVPNVTGESYNAFEDVPYSSQLGLDDLLLNDSDIDGDMLIVNTTPISGPSNGSLVLNTNGTFTYTANSNFNGTDSFVYEVQDGNGGTAQATATITVNLIDDPAVISGDISFTGNEGDAVDGTMTAGDVEGLTDGTYFTVSAATTNGTAAINPATGAWTFTPTDPNWFGSDSFTVTVTDDLGGTTTQVVNITLANVDDPSTIGGIISYSGNEGDAVAGTMTAIDVEGLTDGTYFSITGAATNGTAAINASTGAWTFIPTDPNWFGSDSFTVTVTDDLGGTTTQVINITLANVDDPATIGGAISFSGNEGDAVGGTMTATDVEGLTDGTYFSITGAAANGTAAINPATGAWTFTPTDPNWFGSDSFTVTVTDDLGGTTTQIVNITLANVDDPAVIGGAISFSGNEGDAVGGTMTATDVEGLTDGTYFSITGAAANGTAAINASTGAWIFTPTDPNWFGSDSFTVTVTDDLGGTTIQIMNITLANVDDPAVIGGVISYSGNEGDAVGGTMTASDVEGLTDSTYFTVTSAATNGTAAINASTGTWTFTPTDPNWFGSDSFTVTVTDDLGGTTTQVVNITLANLDDPATIGGAISFSGNEGDAVGGTMTATDVEGLTDSTYFTVTGAATNGTAVINASTGAWTFTPTDPNWLGSDSFTVTVTDDLGGTTTQIVNITLANVDDPAVIGGAISYSGNEGDAVGGTMTASDVEGLTDSTYFTVTGAATNGTAAINATTGAWTFTPTDPNWFGSDSFTVTVIDDLGGTTTQVVNITLANVDDPAVIGGAISYSGNEGDAVGGTMTAADVEGLTDGTYFTVTTLAANGTAAIDPASGAWTFTPTDPNWFGSDSFTVTVTDDLGGTTAQVVNITLANVDDPATIGGTISYSGNEGDAVGGTMIATDVEGLTDGTYFTVSAAATNGTGAINASTGAWTFTPTDPNWFGSDSFTVTVTDDLGGMTTQVVNITLANVDDPSVIGGTISYTGNEGDAVGGTMTATDVDGLTDGTYFNVTVPATNGTATIDPTTGAWTFTPSDPNWFGSDFFEVTVTDDLGGTTTQVVNIVLANVNDIPEANSDNTSTLQGTEQHRIAVLSNDVDIDGDRLIVTQASASNGTVIVNEDGSLSYTADSNFNGIDIITYQISDGQGGISTANVSVTVIPLDGPPIVDLAIDTGIDPDNTIEPVEPVPSIDPEVIESTEPIEEPKSNQDEQPQVVDRALLEQVLRSFQVSDEILLPVVEKSDLEFEGRSVIKFSLKRITLNPVFEAVQLEESTLIPEDSELWTQLDQMVEQMNMDLDEGETTMTVAAGTTVSFTAGFVSWVLRSGSLMASFMSSVPLFKQFDPLPILSAQSRRTATDENEGYNDSDESEARVVERLFQD